MWVCENAVMCTISEEDSDRGVNPGMIAGCEPRDVGGITIQRRDKQHEQQPSRNNILPFTFCFLPSMRLLRIRKNHHPQTRLHRQGLLHRLPQSRMGQSIRGSADQQSDKTKDHRHHPDWFKGSY